MKWSDDGKMTTQLGLCNPPCRRDFSDKVDSLIGFPKSSQTGFQSEQSAWSLPQAGLLPASEEGEHPALQP